MIISQARQRFEDGRSIVLGDWLLAPLYLQRGGKYWLAHRRAIAAQRNTIYEVIFSTINPDHWDHLWKLKLTTEDEPGVAEALCGVLEEFGIRILTAECSVHSRNRYNSMSFILSMEKYDHPLDGAQEDLKNPVTTRVAYLELSLLSAMANHIVFHTSGRPRFELIPMRLQSHFRKDDFRLAEGTADCAETGRFFLPEQICQSIRSTCGDQAVCYSGAVDTEHRLIRVLFFAQHVNGVSHLQVSGAELGTKSIRRVLQHVKDSEANILRFQIRRGLNKRTAVKRLGLDDPAKRRAGGVGPGRFDLTFEPAANAKRAGGVVEALRHALSNDADLRETHIHVTSD